MMIVRKEEKNQSPIGKIEILYNLKKNFIFYHIVWNLEQYKNSVAINSFRSAVESLFKVVLPPAPVKKQEPPEPPPDHSSQPAQYQLPQENRYHEHQQQQHQHHGRRPHHEHSRRHRYAYLHTNTPLMIGLKLQIYSAAANPVLPPARAKLVSLLPINSPLLT